LYIVRQFVQAHGGTVDVVSNERAGTTFRIVLPRQARANTLDAAALAAHH
jgi:signal transduction histidine kinase